MDFVVGLPKEVGLDTIFIVVDRLTKYNHFFTLKHPYTTKKVVSLFIRKMVNCMASQAYRIKSR